MKKLFALLLLMVSYPALSEQLDTPSYSITIQSNCEEGEVSCNNVTYIGVSKKTGNTIKLRGSTWHTTCADGVAPCRFLGYQFRNGGTRYFVSEDGTLEVKDGDKVLVNETGSWR